MRYTDFALEEISRRGALAGALGSLGLSGSGWLATKNKEQPQTKNYSYPEQPVQQDSEFLRKLRHVASELQVNAADLLKVMYFETKGTLSPSITNELGAVGLIQFMPKTAQYLGTTAEALARMSAVEQLDWVLKYYKKNRLSPGSSASDIYLTTLFPIVVTRQLPNEHVMAVNPNSKDRKLAATANQRIVNISKITRGKMWRTNPVFRVPNRDYYTVGDIRSKLDNKVVPPGAGQSVSK